MVEIGAWQFTQPWRHAAASTGTDSISVPQV
jgi:hypothetical protein